MRVTEESSLLYAPSQFMLPLSVKKDLILMFAVVCWVVNAERNEKKSIRRSINCVVDAASEQGWCSL